MDAFDDIKDDNNDYFRYVMTSVSCWGSRERFSSEALWTSSVSCAGNPGRYFDQAITA